MKLSELKKLVSSTNSPNLHKLRNFMKDYYDCEFEDEELEEWIEFGAFLQSWIAEKEYWKRLFTGFQKGGRNAKAPQKNISYERQEYGTHKNR